MRWRWHWAYGLNRELKSHWRRWGGSSHQLGLQGRHGKAVLDAHDGDGAECEPVPPVTEARGTTPISQRPPREGAERFRSLRLGGWLPLLCSRHALSAWSHLVVCCAYAILFRVSRPCRVQTRSKLSTFRPGCGGAGRGRDSRRRDRASLRYLNLLYFAGLGTCRQALRYWPSGTLYPSTRVIVTSYHDHSFMMMILTRERACTRTRSARTFGASLAHPTRSESASAIGSAAARSPPK